MLAQIKLCGFGVNLSQEERVNLGKSMCETLCGGDHPIVTKPSRIIAFRAFGREVVFQFESLALAEAFLSEVTMQGRTIPDYNCKKCFFVKTRIGDDFVKEKAVSKAVRALKESKSIGQEDRTTVKGGRGRGGIWFSSKEVFRVFIENGTAVLKADTNECNELGIDAAAVKARFGQLLQPQNASRFS